MYKSKSMRMRMRSKRMRSKNKTMRMRSKRMLSKSKSKTKRMLSKSKSKSKRKTVRRTRRNMRGGFEPAPGGPYFAGSSAPFPSGTYLPVSKFGVPAGSFDPAVRAGPYPVQGQAGGKRKRSGHKRSGHMRSGHMNRMQRRHMHGGGLSSFISSILPDEIVNIGRSVPSSLGHLADKFNGSISSPSSLVYPTQQPHVYHGSSGATAPQMAPIDVQDAFNRANASVGSI